MAFGVDGHVPRVVELAVLVALLAELEQEGAVECEHLDAVVVLVGDDDAAEVVRSDAGRSVELTGSCAGRAETVVQRAVAVEDLDAVVAAVGDDDEAVLVAGHAPRPAQLALVFALLAEGQQRLADGAVVAAATHGHAERTAVDVPAADQHLHRMATLALWPVGERVGAVLAVLDLGAVRHAVGAVDVGRHRVAADEPRVALVVLDVHREAGHVVAQGPLDAVAQRHRVGREARTGDQPHGADGRHQRAVGRQELHQVILVRLQTSADLAQLLELGHRLVLGV